MRYIERRFVVKVPTKSWLDAWRSHATLARQVGEARLDTIVEKIADLIGNTDTVAVPYFTRAWFARSVAKKPV